MNDVDKYRSRAVKQLEQAASNIAAMRIAMHVDYGNEEERLDAEMKDRLYDLTLLFANQLQHTVLYVPRLMRVLQCALDKAEEVLEKQRR